jgi:hypothetical protein
VSVGAQNSTFSTGCDARFNLFERRFVVFAENFCPDLQIDKLQVAAIDRNRRGVR